MDAREWVRREKRQGTARALRDSEEGEEEGVKTSGRVIGASWLLRKTIEKYYPRRLVETEAPFEVVFSVSDPTTLRASPPRNCAIRSMGADIYLGSAPTDRSVLPTVVPATLGVFRKCFGSALATRRG